MSQNIQDLVVTLQKSYAEGTVEVGVRQSKVARLPTGIFPADLAMGGGWPMGYFSCVYGPEGSGKTNMVLKTIAQAQSIYPDMWPVFVDTEHSLDKNWAARLGVDTDRMIHIMPSHGEEAVDLTHRFLQAGDVSILVLDSLAAMIPLKVVQDEAEKAIVAGNSILVQKLTYRIIHDLNKARLEGRAPVVLGVNQIRYKIGVMHGDPEKMPGGKALDHALEMSIRVFGKGEIDKEVHPSMPAWKDTNIRVKKSKVPTVAANAVYKLALIPQQGIPIGFVDDWPTVKAYLTKLEWMRKDGNTWMLLDEEFPTQKAIRAYLDEHPQVAFNLRQKIVEAELDRIYKGGLIEELEG